MITTVGEQVGCLFDACPVRSDRCQTWQPCRAGPCVAVPPLKMLRFWLLSLLVAGIAAGWEIVYFHDEDKSSLRILAFQFASPTRGVATGLLQRERNRPEPVALVTSDAGITWSVVETRDPGISLLFLSETDGWMVTPGGVWFTQEAGRSWKRILKHEGISGLNFESREKGWAIGRKKTALQTMDGGKRWKEVPEIAALSTNADWTRSARSTSSTARLA